MSARDNYNHRYVNYSWFLGRTPGLNRRLEKATNETFLQEYSIWIEEMWKRFQKETGCTEEEKFDDWLTIRCCLTGKTRLALLDTLSPEQFELLGEIKKTLSKLRNKP